MGDTAHFRKCTSEDRSSCLRNEQENHIAEMLKLSEAFQQHESGIIALDRVLDAVRDAVEYSSCSIHLMEPQGRYVYLAASRDIPANIPEAILNAVRTENLNQSYMQPLLKGQPYRPIEHKADYGYLSTVSAEGVFTGEMAKVPLLSNDRLIGVLTLIYSGSDDHWFENNQTWLSILGRHLGMLMDQAQSYNHAHGKTLLQEQLRMSRELCSNISKHIESISQLAAQMASRWQAGVTDQMDSDLAALENLAAVALSNLDDEIAGLRFAQSADEDFAIQIKTYLAEYQRQWGIETTFTVVDPYGMLNVQPSNSTLLFRTVQESLSNIRKHAKASEVEVMLEVDDATLRVLVVDNGVGFAASSVPEDSPGLFSMRERTHDMGGSFRIISSPGEGTVVRIEVPMRTLASARGDYHD